MVGAFSSRTTAVLAAGDSAWATTAFPFALSNDTPRTRSSVSNSGAASARNDPPRTLRSQSTWSPWSSAQ